MRVSVAQATPPSLSPPSSPMKLLLHRSSSSITLSLSKSTAPNLPRSCSNSFDGHDFTQKQNIQKLSFPNFRRTTSFPHSGPQVDVLEPSLLGIRPEPPDWPARDAVIRDCIARKASSIELPLSLRIIKMKQKFLRMEEERDIGDLGGNLENSPVNNLCCSTLHIIREVQSQALKNRGIVLDEELDGIVSKVQREMTSSFVWLFREVFAKTPELMLQVMLLTSNFATHSLETTLNCTSNTLERLTKDEEFEQNSRNRGIGYLELGKSGVPTKEILEGMQDSEVRLWNSMVEEANMMQGGCIKDKELRFVVDDHDGLMEQKFVFVSPVKVEIERDDYEEYYKTDLLYQMTLFQDPNNTLLLSNYAQFLCLVSLDYDRAEECFKRAIQLDPTDAEVVSQYANFLWVVRKDLWGAEEIFQQAMAAEPSNSYHASKYASFLWSTGGEDTCYPLDPPHGKS